MKYHIKLMDNTGFGECKINITEEELTERFVMPYLNGDEIMINGTVLKTHEVARIKITSSENSIDTIVKEIKSKDKNDRSSFKIFDNSAE